MVVILFNITSHTLNVTKKLPILNVLHKYMHDVYLPLVWVATIEKTF